MRLIGVQEFEMLEPNSVLQKRYRIIKQLGQGGMGAVYEAIDQRVKCMVVLKRTLFDSEDLRRAFEREAGLLANLRHPALPKVTDYFVEGGGQYLVMDHIPGQDLGQMLKAFGRPFAPAEVLRWADELLRVLEYLHGLNPPILHRDIKPSNLKLTESGEVFLLDFGLAKGAAGQMSTIGRAVRSFPGYTPSYAPLEQILRSDSQQPERHWVEVLKQIDAVEVERILATPTDERADLYSLGATLYHLLTNDMPTNAGYRALYVWRKLSDPVRPMSELNPLVPAEVAEVVGSAMALNPERRPPSAGAMRAALRDAGQSLRTHTGLVGLQTIPDEVREAIAEEAARRVSQIFDTKFDELSGHLKSTRLSLEILGTEVEPLKRTSAETESLRKDLTGLVDEIDHLQKALDEARKTGAVARHVTEQAAERAAKEVAWEVIPQLAELLIKQQLDEKAAEARAKKEAPPAQPVVQRRATDMDFPVEVSEEEKRFHNEARRFARLLVSEIKLYNEQKVRDGRDAGDLYDRLREDIDRSRQMYDKRVRPEVSRRYDYFHHELVNNIAAGDPSKLGEDYPGPSLTYFPFYPNRRKGI
jgi:serine/threonine protein kinase